MRSEQLQKRSPRTRRFFTVECADRTRMRRLLMEPLEERALLDVGSAFSAAFDSAAVDENEAVFAETADWGSPATDIEAVTDRWEIVPGEVLVGLRTMEPLVDVGQYVESLGWAANIGSVDRENIHTVYQIPHRESGQLTVVQIFLRESIDVRRAVAEIGELDFVEFAEPNMRYTGNPFLAVPDDPEQFGQGQLPGDEGRYHHDIIQTPLAWGHSGQSPI